jgi:hypothetical protein
VGIGGREKSSWESTIGFMLFLILVIELLNHYSMSFADIAMPQEVPSEEKYEIKGKHSC